MVAGTAERRVSGSIARRYTERGYDDLSRETVRAISLDLYQQGHNILMGIDSVARTYAERVWNGEPSNDWIATTLEGTDHDFNIYHHPTWGVLSIDKVAKTPVDPQSGHRVITEEVEVCIGSNNALTLDFRNPYFNHAGLANNLGVRAEVIDFLADMARQMQPAA